MYYNKYIKYKIKYGTLQEDENTDLALFIKYNKHNYLNLVDCLNSYIKYEFNNFNSDEYNIQLTKKITIVNKKSNTSIEWTWDNIKKEFLGKNNKMMKIFYDFRTKIVNNLLKIIFYYINDCTDLCVYIPSGSTGAETNLSSDYDLTITGNFKISYIISNFNDAIINLFNLTSNEIFDTNIYGYSFLIQYNDKISINKNIWTLDNYKQNFYEIKTSENISYNQDIWAFLRFYTLIKPLNLQIINFDLNEKFINYINNNLEINDIDDLITLNKTPISKYCKYIEKMKIFENNIINNLKSKEEIINNLSFMNAYGEETYFTQGTFMHVVGTMFYYRDINIKREFLKNYYIIHSLVENSAYFINSFINSNYDIIYSIKYLERFMNGYYLLLSDSLVENILSNTNFIKNKLRNKTNDEILKQKEILDLGINSSNINEYKNNIINKLKQDILNLIKTQIQDDNLFYINAMLLLLSDILNKYKENTNLKIIIESQNNIIFTIKI